MTQDFMWWPRNKPIPAGWRMVTPQRVTHHSAWSVLIERKGEKP